MPDAYDHNSLICRLKATQTRNKELESGERYVKLKELHQKECRAYEHKIQALQTEVADAHKETIRVRNYWFQVLEDMLLEFEAMQKKTDQKLREMEKRALLANTLNSLRFVAAMHKDQIVSDGIQALSSLLQNTLTNKNEYITIQEELENLENYFSILRIRYAGSFEYSFHVEEAELLSCLVPKLILQPLAENSVMHGSSDNGTVMEIQITCWREDGDVVIELSDDGKGFEVTDDALASHPERKRIGVANVNDRIQLNFGREYGLKINSQPVFYFCKRKFKIQLSVQDF